MGKIKKFTIVFSNQTAAFYAGQQVTGKVVVELSEPMKIKTVKLKIVGEAAVSFQDTTKAKKSHSGKQNYFEQVDVLFGSADSSLLGETQSLTTGVHEFPFVFNAPSNLPSSFESQFGHVRYHCKAYLARPWKFDDTTKKLFSIISIVDLNSEPAAFTPGGGETERTFSWTDKFFFCVRGGLSVRMKLERTGFVPGENLLINAEINNNSSKKVKKVESYIQQNIIYSVHSGKRFVKGEKKMALLTQGAVNPGKVQIWHQEPMTVPPLPPTRLGGCKLICIDYLFNFVVYVESAETITLTLPIVIGTIPLHDQPLNWLPPSYQQTPRPAPPPAAPSPQRQPSAPPISEYIGPPPSYEECVYMEQANIRDGDDNEETGGDPTYRPLYPRYPTLPLPSENFTLNLI